MRIEDWFLTAEERGNPAYTLPDPLVTSSGERVTTPEAWRQRTSVCAATSRPQMA